MNAHNAIANFVTIPLVESVLGYLTPNFSFGIFVSSVVILSSAVTVICCSKNEDIESDDDKEVFTKQKKEIRLKGMEHTIGTLSVLYSNLEKLTKSNERQIQNIQNYINESSE